MLLAGSLPTLQQTGVEEGSQRAVVVGSVWRQ